MNRKVLTPLIILVIIGGFFFGPSLYFHFQNAVTPPSDPAEHYDFEVHYTAAGFEPALLEIPAGSQVAFKNVTEIPLWIGSDPHPLHTDYPGFDAQRGYASSEIYIFKFEKTGTFSYHNHEKSIDRGFIRIVDPANPLPVIDKTKTEYQRVERDKLIAQLNAADPNSILKVVDAIQADIPLSLNCHDIAHDIGHKAYDLFGFSEAMTFNNPNHLKRALVEYICAGGYMHGVVEELFLNQPSFQTQPDLVCAKVAADDRASCYHGVGHALMFSNKRNVTGALTDCRNAEWWKDRYRCFEGVWMELFWGNTDHAGASSLGWDLEHPLGPCIAANEDEKPTCFLYSSFGYLRTHTKDYDGAVQMCTTDELKDNDTQFCLKGLGLTMMSKFKGQHLEGSEIYVAELSVEEKRAFYEGVMGYARLSGISKTDLQSTCGLFKTDQEICIAVLRDSE